SPSNPGGPPVPPGSGGGAGTFTSSAVACVKTVSYSRRYCVSLSGSMSRRVGNRSWNVGGSASLLLAIGGPSGSGVPFPKNRSFRSMRTPRSAPGFSVFPSHRTPCYHTSSSDPPPAISITRASSHAAPRKSLPPGIHDPVRLRSCRDGPASLARERMVWLGRACCRTESADRREREAEPRDDRRRPATAPLERPLQRGEEGPKHSVHSGVRRGRPAPGLRHRAVF